MPRATCRCGQVLSVPVNGPERVICPKCSSRVRVRRDAPGGGDGLTRFNCPCGRRLKVRVVSFDDGPLSVKCPDCGRIVQVPTPGSSGGDLLRVKPQDPESPTEELDEDDLAMLDLWTSKHLGVAKPAAAVPPPDPAPPPPEPTADVVVPPVKAEAGLRICPRCGRPLHLSAVACRNCGAPAPKR